MQAGIAHLSFDQMFGDRSRGAGPLVMAKAMVMMISNWETGTVSSMNRVECST